MKVKYDMSIEFDVTDDMTWVEVRVNGEYIGTMRADMTLDTSYGRRIISKNEECALDHHPRGFSCRERAPFSGIKGAESNMNFRSVAAKVARAAIAKRMVNPKV